MARTPAKSSHTSKAATAPLARFIAPDAVLAGVYAPADRAERRILHEALLPTFRLYAAWLRSERREPTRDEVIFVQSEGLRRFLLDWPTRPDSLITTEMIAYCWHSMLTGEERAALRYYAEYGQSEPRTLFGLG